MNCCLAILSNRELRGPTELFLLQRIQDEVHRLRYRQLRSKTPSLLN